MKFEASELGLFVRCAALLPPLQAGEGWGGVKQSCVEASACDLLPACLPDQVRDRLCEQGEEQQNYGAGLFSRCAGRDASISAAKVRVCSDAASKPSGNSPAISSI